MANKLFVELGFSISKDSISQVVKGLDKIGFSAIDAGFAFEKLSKKISFSSAVQTFASLNRIAADLKNSIFAVKDAFYGYFDKVNQYSLDGDRIAKTSRLVGMSAKEYQALSHAADLAGISTEEMDSALKKFNVNLGKARGGDKSALKGFSAILPKSLSSYKTNSEVIQAMADSYVKLSSSEQKAFVSQEIFGRSGLKMSELLSGGSQGILEAYKEFENLGGGFSEKDLKNAEQFNDDLARMNRSIYSVKMSLAKELFPVFSDLFNSVRDFIQENKTEIKTTVLDLSKSISDLAKKILPEVPKILSSIRDVLNWLGSDGILAVGIFTTFLPIVGQIVGLAVTLVPVLGKIVGFCSKIAEFGWAFKDSFLIASEVIGGSVLAAVAGVTAFVIGLVVIVKQFYDNWEMWSSFVRDDLKNTFGIVGAILDGVASGIASIFYFFYELPDLISKVWTGFWDGLEKVWESLKDLSIKIYDAIVGSVTSAWNSVKGLLGNLPIIGDLFDGGGNVSNTLGSSVGQMVSSTSTTTTSRFVVDFQNMPRGTTVTPPDKGDFDYSRGYMLAGVV